MKKILFLIILPVALGFVSCKKDSGNPAAAPDKFMTFTAGSSWNYKQTNNPSTTPTVSNYTLTATSNDSTANGRSYRIFSNSAGPNEYYNITGGDYYTFMKLPDNFGGTSVEVLYLKDNLNTGETWEQAIPVSVSGFALILTFKNKIAQKGISKTVNGITYSNVTEVETSLSVTGIPFAFTLTSDIRYYYAPKVGQIENKSKIDLVLTGFPPTNFEQKTELQSSTIL